jgi:hypothetical protein
MSGRGRCSSGSVSELRARSKSPNKSERRRLPAPKETFGLRGESAAVSRVALSLNCLNHETLSFRYIAPADYLYPLARFKVLVMGKEMLDLL